MDQNKNAVTTEEPISAPSEPVSAASEPISDAAEQKQPRVVYVDATPQYGSGAQPVRTLPDGAQVVYRPVEPEKAPRRKALDRAAGEIGLWLLMLLSVLFGSLYSRFIFKGGLGIGVTVMTALYYAVYAWFIRRRSVRLSVPAVMTAVPLLILAVSYSFNASRNGRWLTILTLIGLFMMQTTLLSGSTDTSRLSSRTVRDALYTHIPETVSNIGGTLTALFGRGANKKEKNSSTGVRVLVGLVISIPIVALLIALFRSADAAFDKIISDIIDMFNIDFWSILGDIIIGIILTVYFMPLALSLRSGYSVERKDKPQNRPLDPVIFATISFASCLVYISFVLVQFRYLFAGEFADYFGFQFDSRPVLPDGMTWAEYARSGFKEMSFIIISTFIVISLLIRFCRRTAENKMPPYLSAALTVIAACDAIIALSAAMRMRLYSKWCGLTSARIGVFIIIAVIALSLAVIIFKLWNDRVKAFAAIGALSVAAVLVFSCMDVDRICADVNVSRYLEKGTMIDMDYLGDLSYAAAPAVERLMNEAPDKDISNAAKGLIAKYYYRGEFGEEPMYEHTLGEWTLDHQRAYRIYLKYKPSRKDMRDYYRYANYQIAANEYSRLNGEDYPYTYENYCDMNEYTRY